MNQCPRPINTATDLSIEWCQKNGHCGCVPLSILRRQYGESVYPVRHSETIHCPKCGQLQKARVNHTVPFYSYAHECACGYWITESEWERELAEQQKNVPPEFVKIVEENFWELLS